MNVALVCIAKKEENYIEEWVKYNIKLGFDKIFIYEDEWECPINDPKVIKIKTKRKGRHRIVETYNDFLDENFDYFDHAAFFDVDEFLVLKKHNNVKEFLTEYSDVQSIGINWVHFGDNGLKEVIDNDYSTVKRFTKRRKAVSEAVKNILKLDIRVGMVNHEPRCTWYSTERTPHTGAGNINGTDDVAQLNHYYCKTIQEFKEKKMLYRVDDNPLGMHEFEKYNFNEVEDLSAYNFFYS